MYLYGGNNGAEGNSFFYKLDLNSFYWEIVDYFDENSVIRPRDSHSAVFSQEFNQMIVFGGFIDGDRTNEVLIYDFTD
jgi:hypothetical protein